MADDYSIRDAVLTPLGRSQASSLPSSTTSLQPKVQLVVSSPLRRTLQTTLLGFPSPLKRLEAEKGTGKSTLVILPQLQECNDLPCDTGSDRSFLEKIPEFEGLDFSNLTDDWNSKKGFYAAQTDALKERSRWVRRWLRSREEDVIVVVSHGDFLRYLTRGENTFEVSVVSSEFCQPRSIFSSFITYLAPGAREGLYFMCPSVKFE